MNPPQENPSDNSLGDNSLINDPHNQTSQADSITQLPDNANEPESHPALGGTADISTESFTVPVRMNENSAQAPVSTNDFQVQPTVTAPVSTSGPYGSDVTEPTVTDQVTRPYSPTNVQSNQPVAPTMTNSPAAVVSGAVGSVQPNPSTNTSVPVSGKSGRRNISKTALIISAVLVLLGMTAGYVFGYYIPNKPENVWKTGMNRTGKAISLLTDTALEKEQVKKVEAGVMEMSITGKTKEVSFSGNLDAKLNDAKLVLKTTVDYSATAGEAEKHELDIDLLASLPENAIFPTVYAKLSGLTAADTQGLAPTVAQYLDKWIYADEKMIKETYPEYAASLEETQKYAKDSVKVEDVSKFIKGLTVTTNEYVFTSDPEKAVLEMREVVGKEKLGDINTIHYKASLNKANAIKYCEAAAASAYGSDLFKKLAS